MIPIKFLKLPILNIFNEIRIMQMLQMFARQKQEIFEDLNSVRDNICLVAVIKKPADKEELLAATAYFKPQKLSIITYTDNPRIRILDISKWFSKPDINLTFFEIERKKLTAIKFIAFLQTLEPYKIIALPIGNHRAFYKSVPTLKKQGKIIIHIADGVSDSFSLWGFVMAVKARGFKGFFKAVYTFFEYLPAKGDYCFFQLYPLAACLAKETLPPMKPKPVKIPKQIEELLIKNKVETLLLPGWGETVASLLEHFPGIKNYCATTKERKIYINGQVIELEGFIIAEDIIKSVNINRVVGTASSAVYFAKIYNSAINCDVLLNGFLNKQWGMFYEHYYKLYGEKLGIQFVKK